MRPGRPTLPRGRPTHGTTASGIQAAYSRDNHRLLASALVERPSLGPKLDIQVCSHRGLLNLCFDVDMVWPFWVLWRLRQLGRKPEELFDALCATFTRQAGGAAHAALGLREPPCLLLCHGEGGRRKGALARACFECWLAAACRAATAATGNDLSAALRGLDAARREDVLRNLRPSDDGHDDGHDNEGNDDQDGNGGDPELDARALSIVAKLSQLGLGAWQLREMACHGMAAELPGLRELKADERQAACEALRSCRGGGRLVAHEGVAPLNSLFGEEAAAYRCPDCEQLYLAGLEPYEELARSGKGCAFACQNDEKRSFHAFGLLPESLAEYVRLLKAGSELTEADYEDAPGPAAQLRATPRQMREVEQDTKRRLEALYDAGRDDDPWDGLVRLGAVQLLAAGLDERQAGAADDAMTTLRAPHAVKVDKNRRTGRWDVVARSAYTRMQVREASGGLAWAGSLDEAARGSAPRFDKLVLRALTPRVWGGRSAPLAPAALLPRPSSPPGSAARRGASGSARTRTPCAAAPRPRMLLSEDVERALGAFTAALHHAAVNKTVRAPGGLECRASELLRGHGENQCTGACCSMEAKPSDAAVRIAMGLPRVAGTRAEPAQGSWAAARFKQAQWLPTQRMWSLKMAGNDCLLCVQGAAARGMAHNSNSMYALVGFRRVLPGGAERFSCSLRCFSTDCEKIRKGIKEDWRKLDFELDLPEGTHARLTSGLRDPLKAAYGTPACIKVCASSAGPDRKRKAGSEQEEQEEEQQEEDTKGGQKREKKKKKKHKKKKHGKTERLRHEAMSRLQGIIAKAQASPPQ